MTDREHDNGAGLSRWQPYPSYKDSGVAWLGAIPNHWVTSRIKFTTYVKARVGWHGLTSEEHIDEGPYLVTGTDFIEGKVNWETCYHVSKERYDQDPFIQLQNGDLLITKDGTIGKVALVEGLKGDATLNSGVFVTRPIRSVYITPFMFWVLNSEVFDAFIFDTSMGSTIQHLYQRTFNEFVFPIPSLEEQLTIAAFLDRETAKIDALIAKQQRLIELLQEQRAVLISHAVTKGLDPSVPMRESGIEWLGKIPAHWKIAKVGKICQSIVPGRDKPQLFDGDIPWITLPDIQSQLYVSASRSSLGVSEAEIADVHTRIVPKDSVIMSCVGEFGITAIADRDVIINQQLHAFVPSSDLDPYFLAHVLRAEKSYMTSLASTTTVPYLNKDKCNSLPIPFPPISEQKKISCFIRKATGKIDSLIPKIDAAILRFQEYRTALISAAVTGKIDVRGEV
jgi:type I restriction enzyme S subunit